VCVKNIRNFSLSLFSFDSPDLRTSCVAMDRTHNEGRPQKPWKYQTENNTEKQRTRVRYCVSFVSRFALRGAMAVDWSEKRCRSRVGGGRDLLDE
jgi:hypothetical protein